jgi:CRP/FNR family transcriptional regulator
MPCNNCHCPFQEILAAKDSPSSAEFQCLLEDSVQHVSFRHGEVLFMQGQPSTCLFAVREGRVKICSHNSEGHEQIVGLSSPDSSLVGLQSMGDERYAYSAIAASDVNACKINHRTLLRRVRGDSDLAMRLIYAMNAHIAHSRSLTEVLGHKCAAAKIASFLLLLTLGLSEETVCRLMAGMRREGAIVAPRGKIEIRDWDRLHAIADGQSKVDIHH